MNKKSTNSQVISMPPPPRESSLTSDLFSVIHPVIEQARNHIAQQANSAMVEAYWHIGRLIVEHEQQGQQRAAYGTQQLKQLAERLTEAFGKGFDLSNLRRMRSFYSAFPIQGTLRPELSWSHYRQLISVDNPTARQWYLEESISQYHNIKKKRLPDQTGNLLFLLLNSWGDRWGSNPRQQESQSR